MIGQNEKIIILMPVFNDWGRYQVLNEINIVIKDIKNFEFKC